MPERATNILDHSSESAEPDTRVSSNAIHLTGRQWIGVGIFAVALILFGPLLWERVEKFEPDSDYRMPYDLSGDYWLYERYAKLAAERYDTVLIGDSVVWGQYVTREQTLSHHLNEQAGKQRFANLGLDGAHPAALAGLIEHYAGGVRGKNVLLQCNLLWLSSPRHDLQVEEDFRFNHPRLVPQFVPAIPCYKEEVSARIGILVEQRVPFTAWTNHLQQAYFERTDIPSWTFEHPYDNPLETFTNGVPPSDNSLRHEPVSWTARGIKKQEFPWVDPTTSFQWRSFQRTVEVLQRRGNRVFVLLGPFNEHMLTEKHLHYYLNLKSVIEAWLLEKGIAFTAPPPLPSEQYADASHPLSVGYALLARQLYQRLPR